MCFNDGATNGQSQTDATGGTFRLPAFKFLENDFLFPFGQSRAVIVNPDFDCPVHDVGADFDQAARWRVFHRVFQQVVDNPLHQHGVDVDQRQVFIERDLDPMLGKGALQRFQGADDDFLQGLPLPVQLNAA